MVLAPDDMGDPVPDIIDNIAEKIERLPVGTDDDEIVHLAVVAFDASQHLVVISQHANAFRDPETDNEGCAGRLFLQDFFRSQVSAGPVIAQTLFGGKGRLPFGVQVFLGAETFIGIALTEQTFGCCDMVVTEPGLEVGPLVPVDAQPFQAVQYSVKGCGG